MRATMMDTPLTISTILRYGTTAYAEREVITATPDGVRRRTYGELGAHVMRHEISVEGPLREYYLIGFLETNDPDQWETEIGWPIFRSAS